VKLFSVSQNAHCDTEDFCALLTNCVGVFCETGSVTHKKDVGRPIVRTEEIVETLNKLRRTFSNP
jgi:hypothetical protein